MDIRFVLLGSFFEDRLRPQLSARYVLRQGRIAPSFGETTTPDFFLLDARIRYQPIISLTIIAGVENLLDVRYYEHLTRSVRGSNAPIFVFGRNAFATLSWRF